MRAGPVSEAEWEIFERGVKAMKRFNPLSPAAWPFQAHMHGYDPNWTVTDSTIALV
jgi:hypothetical protein